MSSFISLVRSCNNFTPAQERSAFTGAAVGESPAPLFIGTTPVGMVRPDVQKQVRNHPKVFIFSDRGIEINPLLSTPEERTNAVEAVLQQWRSEKLFPSLKGWRSERYSVWGEDGEIIMQIERAGAGLLGFRAYGVHINGYVMDGDKTLMWVARRSFTKQTYPGMLDNLVGGGLPHGYDPKTCAVKECFEEAGLSSNQLVSLRSVSSISYFMDSPDRGLLPDFEFIYDLQVDKDWKPNCQDGEVAAFYLMTLDEVAEKLQAGEFTPEAGLVSLEFLIRFGHINPNNEPLYAELVTDLRRSLPFPSPSFR
ncbi:NUDIX hydrolase domain-like protein [Chytridium lagenaria]|nr:NUDIX hydrolase domain-like protein [Chytridium lagenaria]